MKPTDLLKKPVDCEFISQLLNRAIDGIRTYYILLTAIKLGIFDVLQTPRNAKTLSKELGCDEKLLSLFCESLCELGILTKINDAYANSEMSRMYLTINSHLSQQIPVINTERIVNLWCNLHEILKKGATKFSREEFFSNYAIHSMAQTSLLGELQETVEFISNFPEFKNAKKLLDLGGGHGFYAIAFTAINENLKAYVFDLPNVIDRTKEYIKKYNATRVEVISGDFFVDELGKDYDIIFSSYNPGGKKLELIPKIHSSLKEGGLYINKQFFPDVTDSNALLNLEWNLWVFDGVKKVEKGNKIYSFKNDVNLDEYIESLESAGFEILEVVDVKSNVKGSKIIVTKKVT